MGGGQCPLPQNHTTGTEEDLHLIGTTETNGALLRGMIETSEAHQRDTTETNEAPRPMATTGTDIQGTEIDTEVRTQDLSPVGIQDMKAETRMKVEPTLLRITPGSRVVAGWGAGPGPHPPGAGQPHNPHR